MRWPDSDRTSPPRMKPAASKVRQRLHELHPGHQPRGLLRRAREIGHCSGVGEVVFAQRQQQSHLCQLVSNVELARGCRAGHKRTRQSSRHSFVLTGLQHRHDRVERHVVRVPGEGRFPLELRRGLGPASLTRVEAAEQVPVSGAVRLRATASLSSVSASSHLPRRMRTWVRNATESVRRLMVGIYGGAKDGQGFANARFGFGKLALPDQHLSEVELILRDRQVAGWQMTAVQLQCRTQAILGFGELGSPGQTSAELAKNIALGHRFITELPLEGQRLAENGTASGMSWLGSSARA
jgi:hypothetical protein